MTRHEKELLELEKEKLRLENKKLQLHLADPDREARNLFAAHALSGLLANGFTVSQGIKQKALEIANLMIDPSRHF